ncbi:DgyrCDS11728 [Dimorphilus gyrociliatus]|uniref:polyribonucleotide nucleotidyltransferase n=1 Tax=Dimorphilus gyrociliatus TaxID=2664684 RepID=A0A7I8W567_9ANNE|nr:DgyrCDS11728 [Dimorphilus gyrociliatus]
MALLLKLGKLKSEKCTQKAIDITLDGILLESDRGKLLSEFVYHLLYVREQISMPHTQLLKMPDKNTESKKLNIKREHIKIAANSLQRLGSYLDKLFIHSCHISSVAILLGSSPNFCNECFVVNFPIDFFEGHVLPATKSRMEFFKSLFQQDFLNGAIQPKRKQRMFIFIKVPPASKFSSDIRDSLIFKQNFKLPTKGNVLYNVNIKCNATIGENVSFSKRFDLNISGVEPFEQPEIVEQTSRPDDNCKIDEWYQIDHFFQGYFDKSLNLSTGKFARFSDGCAVGNVGNTSVMVTTVSRKQASKLSFMPLTVDYRQKTAAAGRIPTNFLRRDLAPSEKEILISRLIDRSIRPLFPNNFFYETQVMCNLLAVDHDHDPDVISINAASAALALSDIPWDGPIGSTRVGVINNEIVLNPTRKQLKSSNLNLVVTAAKDSKVVMIEGSAENIDQQTIQHAIKKGVKSSQSIINSINQLCQKCGKPKREIIEEKLMETQEFTDEIKQKMNELANEKIRQVLTNFEHHKFSRDNALSEIRQNVSETLLAVYPDLSPSKIQEELNNLVKAIFRSLIFETNIRCDGRGLDDLRNISCETGLYNPLHGSALFQRGQTQVLCTLTFDSPLSAAKIDTISALTEGIKEKNFFLHYEFPPYATNEVGRLNWGRREIGHGALAERALRPLIPSNFPFTLRLSAEVLESNGSSSMASVCAGSLALYDAGVPIDEAAAGVAIGLMTKDDDYRVLTDLLGIEDYMGDMDFKLAGTKQGVTAIQADIKIPGVPLKIMMEAIQKGMQAKKKILDKMNAVLPNPSEPKSNRPVVEEIEVPLQKRAKFLGAGGFNLKRILLDTGVSITQIDDTKFNIFAPNSDSFNEAREKIDELLQDEKEITLEFGAIYDASIVEIRDYGVMVKLYETMQPSLIHVSQLDQKRVQHPSALGLEVGQEIKVKYFGRDPADGKMRLSRKVLQTTNPVARSTLKK